MKVKSVIAGSPSNSALITTGTGLISLALDTQVHNVVSADGTVVNLGVVLFLIVYVVNGFNHMDIIFDVYKFIIDFRKITNSAVDIQAIFFQYFEFISSSLIYINVLIKY